MNQPSPVTIRKPDEGRTIGIVGDIYRLLVTGDETGGRYAMFEAVVLPGVNLTISATRVLSGATLRAVRRDDAKMSVW